MRRKVAVAVVHGIGKQTANFAEKMTSELNQHFGPETLSDIVIRTVFWAPVLQQAEDVLWQRVQEGGTLHFPETRRMLIDFLADALAYQPTNDDRRAYDGIHAVFAQTLADLAAEAGPDAPLCIIGHSLGTIIASNYIYDLQVDSFKHLIGEEVRALMTGTPLEKGETLALLYTMGSPIALWSLRYREFGRPIVIPAPQLRQYHSEIEGEWVNYYDQDDVFGFPLKTLNPAYERMVTRDAQVNVGGLLESWNPLAHFGYWTDRDVVEPMAKKLVEVWKGINGFA
ncbi:MAG TPA: hypothetical protein VER79_08875 [Candidatus Limnocylindrales bacterium]|nr:hypothetical protein [Candidatus Limnocylindrales bacterium]